MVFSIFLLLGILLITLDSIGSKRLRSRVISRSKTIFAEADSEESRLVKTSPASLQPLLQSYLNYSTGGNSFPISVRIRYKAAVRRADRKYWQPIEAKLYLTAAPWRMINYEDFTLGFLISLKRIRLIDEDSIEQSQYWLSLFTSSRVPELMGKMHQWACLIWQPGHPAWARLKGQAESAKMVTYQLKKETIQFNWQIDQRSGEIGQFRAWSKDSLISLLYVYGDYQEVGDYHIPMTFEVEEKYGKKEYLYKCRIADIVFDEDFAWW